MPIETFTTIDSLNVSYPVATDPLADTDDHLRGVKATIKTTFPNVTGAVTATHTALNNAAGALSSNILTVPAGSTSHDGGHLVLTGQGSDPNAALVNATGALTVKSGSTTTLTLSTAGALSTAASLNAPSVQKGGYELIPIGCIIMWYGSIGSIPAGWQLCDGSNGTPDLRDRFVCGAGITYSPLATGGAGVVSVTSALAGGHSHGGATAAAGGHAHSASTDAQGAHSHGGVTGDRSLTVDQIPAHSHNYHQASTYTGTIVAPLTLGGGSDTPVTFSTESTGSGNPHSHAIGSDGSHGHNVTVNAVGDHAHSITAAADHQHGVTVPTVPPFMALAFIMKVV